MPCSEDDIQLQQMYDRQEPWSREENIGIRLVAVAAHEWGHALGLDHSSQPGALMAPYYDGAIIEPQDDDIRRIQALYEPVEAPTKTVVQVTGTMTIAGGAVTAKLEESEVDLALKVG
jgi:hypothetical protein